MLLACQCPVVPQYIDCIAKDRSVSIRLDGSATKALAHAFARDPAAVVLGTAYSFVQNDNKITATSHTMIY